MNVSSMQHTEGLEMRILVAGDTHGEPKHAGFLVRTAANHRAEGIIVTGDFGLWDHTYDGVEFLDSLNAMLRNYNRYLVWVDGNHENFDSLEQYHARAPRSKNGHVYIRSNILHAPRGLVWKWAGKKFMSVGGAVSVDKAWRLQAEREKYGARTLWWDQEVLTASEASDIIRAVQERREHGKPDVDYLFTHDCPNNAPFRHRLKDDPASHAHRQVIEQVARAVKPKMWFHGHMHEYYAPYPFPTYESHTTVVGMGMNGDRNSWGILEVETGEFTIDEDMPC